MTTLYQNFHIPKILLFLILSFLVGHAYSQAPPVNDEPCGALPITCDMAPLNGSFVNATLSEQNECAFQTNPGDVWFTFESDGVSTYQLSASTGSASVNTVLYKGEDCSDLTLALPCGGSQTITEQLPAGRYYYSVRPSNLSPSENNYRIRFACASGPPENDDPCDALSLECPADVIHGNTLFATQTMDGDCFFNGIENDVWFTFDANGVSSYLIVETGRSLGAMQLFRSEDCSGSLTEVESCQSWTTQGNFKYFSDVYEAGTYYLRIMNNSQGLGRSYSINLYCNPLPANDERCTAQTIECGETIAGTTTGATPESDGSCGAVNSSPAVWYAYTATASGNVNFSLCNQADFNSRLSVYAAVSCSSSLLCIASNNNYADGQFDCGQTSYLPNIAVEEGVTYYILVHGQNIATGDFELSVECAGGIQGCTDATAINYNPDATTDNGSCSYADVVECGEFVQSEYCYANNDNSVFSYASSNGDPLTLLFIDATLEGYDVIRIYDGYNIETGTLLFDYVDVATYDWLFENPNIAGYTFEATSGAIVIEFDAEFNGSCEDLDVPPAKWQIGCGTDTPVLGCTDPDAVNFNPDATIFDHSCLYPLVNDEACGALPLSCNSNRKYSSLEGATMSAEVSGDACETPGDPSAGDVWFSFESDGTSLYEVGATVGSFTVALFTGDDCGELTPVQDCQQVGSPNSISGYFEAGTYYFSVRPSSTSSPSTGTQAWVDCFVPPAPPENDLICNASELVCNGPFVSHNIGGATSSWADDPCGETGGEDVWYTFEADGVSIYRVELIDPEGARSVSLYQASACDGLLTEMAICQSGDLFFQGVLPEGTYYFRDRNDDTALNIDAQSVVSLTCNGAPLANDEPCGAFDFVCSNSPDDLLMGSFTGSTVSPGSPGVCSNTVGDVWLKIDVTQTGSYSIYQPILPRAHRAVYFGDDCSEELTLISSCSSTPPSVATYTFSNIGTYYVRVIATGNSDTYALRLQCNEPPVIPENDLACGAIDVDCNTGTVAGKTSLATADDGCGYGSGKGIWYRYTSDIFGSVTLNTCNIVTEFKIDLSVYTGSDCTDLACYTNSGSVSGCSGHPALTFDVVPGETYHILVEGYTSSSQGLFEMDISCEERAPDCPDLFVDFGEPCDDGDPTTYGDRIDADCQCTGSDIPDSACGEYSSSPSLAFGSTWDVVTDSIVISGTEAIIADMDVAMVIDHSRSGDVRARLISPAGTVVELIKTPCNGSGINVGFDDEAGIAQCNIGGEGPAFIGIFKPLSPLFYLNGESLNGTWKLEVNDVQPSFASGTLTSWCLIPDLSGFDCPSLEANIGDACNDGNPDTENDMVTENCDCAGTPICQEPFPPVTGMSVDFSSAGMLATWTPVPGSIGCQHQLKRVSDGTLIIQQYQQEPEASEIFAGGFLFNYGTEYTWRIRCGCSANPLVAGPWRALEFTTPGGPEISSSPNPTSGTSVVSFSIMRPENATLEVYDLNGRSLEVVYTGQTNPEQEYRFEYDASALPQGVYLYRLTTETATVVAKFMVAK